MTSVLPSLVLLPRSVRLSVVVSFFAYMLAEVKAVMMVKRRHRPVSTGATAAGECTYTLHDCIDIGFMLTPEDWRV